MELVYISSFFLITVLLSILWFFRATKSLGVLSIVSLLTILQSVLALSGFYHDTSMIPPRLMIFGVFPSLLLIIVAFLTKKGQKMMDSVNLKDLTAFHTIRIPVEIVLYLLYQQKLVSIFMTFEGTNFDLFSGITAPFIAYFAWKFRKVNYQLLLAWNMVCLLLLLNVVGTAIFAIPSPFQQLAFDQPNVAVLDFPFSLLPAIVVPLVLFAHLIAFRRILQNRTK